ncbi:MAG: Gfo/Idh/MocA family protein, partial [Sphingopyxis sp.]
KQMELVACCGRDAERTGAFAGDRAAAGYIDLDLMLQHERLDLVIATLPPFDRSGEIERVARAGVHLLVEKPIALDQQAADAMVAEVGRADVVAAIGFMYRFGDAVRRWKDADTGQVGLYAGAYHCNALHADWWREEAKSGGQILEQVIHQVDLIRHLMGEPDSVYARRANFAHHDTPGYDIEDISAIVFGWDDGRIATLNASNIAVPGVWHKEWAVYAERMTGRFTGWNDAVLTRTAGEAAVEEIAGPTDPFVAQLADVHRAITAGGAPAIPLSEGAASLRLALAARQSADERREIRLTR